MKSLIDMVRSLGALGPLALFTVAMPAVSIPILVETRDAWFAPAQAAGMSCLPWFVLIGAALAGLSLVPTHAVSLVAGLLFGAVVGPVVALVSVVLGATVGFGVLRPLVSARTLAALGERPRAAAVHRALVHSGARRAGGLIALVRLSPVMPFAASNLVFAAAGSGWREFLLGSTVGLAPRVVAVAVMGAGLAELDFETKLGATWAVIGVALTVATIVVVGRLARRALREELETTAPISSS